MAAPYRACVRSRSRPKSEIPNWTESNLRFQISDLRCRIRPISNLLSTVHSRTRYLVPISVLQNENVHVTGLHPRSILRPTFAGVEEPGRLIIHLNIDPRIRLSLPVHIVISIDADVSWIAVA